MILSISLPAVWTKTMDNPPYKTLPSHSSCIWDTARLTWNRKMIRVRSHVSLSETSDCIRVKGILEVLMMLAHIYRNKEQEIRWERKATVHAKPMGKDDHRHTPAKAELDTIDAQFMFKWTGSMYNYAMKRQGGKKWFLLKDLFYKSKLIITLF